MRHALVASVLALTSGFIPSAQERSDFSGTWSLPADAPLAPNGKPAAAPGFGPTIDIRHGEGSFTISRLMGGGTVHVTHPLDGTESRSRTPGRLCEGDAQSVWAARWEGDAIVTTLVGSVPPGASTVTTMNVSARFALQSADTLSVATTFQNAGMPSPRTITTLYRKTGPPAAMPAAAAAPVREARITQADWLGGTWIGTAGANAFEERWTPAAGGSMLAVARSMRNGIMTGFEFLCIVERNGGLVYQAMPNGRQPATDFSLTEAGPNTLTFENPAHDFPKKIRYTLGPDGTLEAVVSGTDKQKPQIFRFRKQ